jgi:hypothetical protein
VSRQVESFARQGPRVPALAHRRLEHGEPPPMQSLLGAAALPVHDLLFLLPYPFIVWGADELRRWLARRHTRPQAA